ncbi:MAG: heavy-metal-associated domain-containing protein [Ignavibacteria bacterium]|nr:heavy-metal-associated domain-containing protein [Ignavibacteria bacterium]
MTELKFKTNINCNHCIKKITPLMDEEKKITEWKVDIENPDKILTVSGEEISEQLVKDVLAKAGYVAEKI